MLVGAYHCSAGSSRFSPRRGYAGNSAAARSRERHGEFLLQTARNVEMVQPALQMESKATSPSSVFSQAGPVDIAPGGLQTIVLWATRYCAAFRCVCVATGTFQERGLRPYRPVCCFLVLKNDSVKKPRKMPLSSLHLASSWSSRHGVDFFERGL